MSVTDAPGTAPGEESASASGEDRPAVERSLASALVGAGLDGARVVFGPGGDAIPAGRLAERGAGCFADGAAPAVGVLMTNDRPTVEVLLGALVTGTPVVSLPLPSRGADMADYVRFLTGACRSQGVDEIVVDDAVASLVREVELGVPVRSHSEIHDRPLAQPAAGGFRLVQFSSGSTGAPKPVLLDDAALGANIMAMLTAVRPRPHDISVSWLPLSHDMGLVGMLLSSIAAGSRRWAEDGDIVLLEPAQFLRRPSMWLEAVDHWGGTFSAAPDFGYRMAAARPPSGAIDLSSWRCAIVGGEIVRADTLEAFAATYRTQGFDPVALCPAYGMAEIGLAATMTPVREPWRALAVSTAELMDGVVVAAPEGAPSTTVVASGRPLDGYDVRFDAAADVDGDAVRVGGMPQIAVRGPSLGADAVTGEPLGDADGWYPTGDAGFSDGGWVHVCGRIDDHIVAHGRKVHAPAIEAVVGEIDGVRGGRVVAVGLPDGDWVVVAEPSAAATVPRRQADELRQAVRRGVVRVASAQPDAIVLVRRGTLPLTSSGKLQRHEVRRRLVAGCLEVV